MISYQILVYAVKKTEKVHNKFIILVKILIQYIICNCVCLKSDGREKFMGEKIIQ